MAGPKGPGIQRNRTNGKFKVLIKEENTGLVIERGAQAFAGSLREDDDLPALRGTDPRFPDHLAKRRWPQLTLDGNKLEFLAKCAIERDGQKLRLHHQSGVLH